MTRPTWNKICMDLAKSIALRSTCSNPNRQVGCVITDAQHTRVLAWGYNGVASGEGHQCEYLRNSVSNTRNEHNYRCSCVHAEQNCLVKLNAFDSCRKIMYLTLSPCMLCARLIINAGINEIWIGEYYSDTTPIYLLKELGVEVYEYQEK